MASETVFLLKVVKGLSPKFLASYLQLHINSVYQAKSTVKNIAKQIVLRSVNFNNILSQEWNNLRDDIKPLPSPISFKKSIT